MKKLVLLLSLVMVLGLTTVGNAVHVNNGGGFIYGTNLNIARHDSPKVERTGDPLMAWAANLAAGGETGWRLPSALYSYGRVTYSDPAGDNALEALLARIEMILAELRNLAKDVDLMFRDPGEMGHLYDAEFRYTAGAGEPLSDEDPFSKRSRDAYWADMEYAEYAEDTIEKWASSAGINFGAADNSDPFHALEVQKNNVGSASTVPIPAGVWLLGSGLVALFGMRRKFKK